MTTSSTVQSLRCETNDPGRGEKRLQDILNYTNKQMKQAISERKPLATTAGPRSLIFRGAITGVDTSKKGCSSMK